MALLLSATAAAQNKAPSPPAAVTAAAQLSAGIRLAETGRCKEALPYLRKPLANIADKDLRRRVGVSRVRCAMASNRMEEAGETMQSLTREFPDDADVLYLAVHVYSDLSIRASQNLLLRAPDSYQVHQLNAEALETQGKWDEAAEEYRAVLKKNPGVPGIHYLLGRLILSKPKTTTTMDDAKREFEEELKINPSNAGAEFVLGEIARQAQQTPQAIEHFSRAAKLDAGFADAFLGLGRSLLEADRSAEAITPLQTAVKLQPDNPTAHFALANAYRLAGRTEDADREFLAHKAAAEKARAATQEVKRGVSAGLEPGVPEKSRQ